MYQITQITSDAAQEQTLVLPDGSQIFISMYFSPMQYSWIFTEITYNSFTLQSLRITNNSNMLRQWKNILPFGIACYSVSDREPSLIGDFATGNSALYVLTASEVQQFEQYLIGQNA